MTQALFLLRLLNIILAIYKTGDREEIGTKNDNHEHHHDLVNNNEQDIEQVAAPTRLSFMLGLLPKVKRLFTAVGLNRCTIL